MKKLIILLMLAFTSMCLAPTAKAAKVNQFVQSLNTEMVSPLDLLEEEPKKKKKVKVIIIIIEEEEEDDGGDGNN